MLTQNIAVFHRVLCDRSLSVIRLLIWVTCLVIYGERKYEIGLNSLTEVSSLLNH